jgi:GT2 family glycosyltransferase
MGESVPKVGVSLLTCNLAEHPAHAKATEFALMSLLDSDLMGYDYQVQVVDNGSTCGATRRLLHQYNSQRVQVHWVGMNLGIAGGRNLAYQMLEESFQPTYIVEVHTDHVFPRKWLSPILDRFEEPEYANAGIIGPALVTGGGEWRAPRLASNYDRSYAEFRSELEAAAERMRRKDRAVPGLTHPCVVSWAMVESLNVRDATGRLCLYDPELPGRQNFEDTELCFRADAAGWSILIDFSSVVYHHYHYSRLTGVLNDIHGHGYNTNYAYCLNKHGNDEWLRFQGQLGQWLEAAFRG